MKSTALTVLILMTTIALFTGATGDEVPLKEAKLVKITKKRIPLDEELLKICGLPEELSPGPHSYADVDIFVNDTVLKYRQENPKKFSYPIGSTFVKKKYSGKNPKDATMATLMVKTKNEGAVSDWKFSMVRLPGYKAIDLKKGNRCVNCHENFEDHGYVSKVSENLLLKHLRLPAGNKEKAGDPPTQKTP